MDHSEFELSDPGLPACPLMQECWDAAGLWTGALPPGAETVDTGPG